MLAEESERGLNMSVVWMKLVSKKECIQRSIKVSYNCGIEGACPLINLCGLERSLKMLCYSHN